MSGIDTTRAQGATDDSQLAEDRVLEVSHLKKYFPIEKGLLKRVAGYVRAVDDVSFYVKKGEILGLVGESGCGKTTTARMIVRALKPTDGSITIRTPDGVFETADIHGEELKQVRRYVQMVFQDPYASLNPRMRVHEILSEPLINFGYARNEMKDLVDEFLTLVGLDPKYRNRYPHAFSGGQRQRIGIARALILRPSLVIADEPVSALDVSVQAQILNLLKDLQQKLGLSMVFIAHNLSVIAHICDRIAVMYLGRVVELADTNDVFDQPVHPYTRVLISAVPDADPRVPWLDEVPTGEVGDPSANIPGCPFSPRCKFAEPECDNGMPPLKIENIETAGTPHYTACRRSQMFLQKQ
ncbi:MAG: ATP-binding cassette domain-containing protein [Spirochaetaceae bacterium]|nr:MAG: ATP-binding cassette domain-containing protein [Spirochaetaceae bacterium]